MRIEKKPIIIIQGAAYGSEAKGAAAAALGHKYGVDYAVRTGAVNAGHTAYAYGRRYVCQQLPVGWVNGDKCSLVIGPGAYVHPVILTQEIAMAREAGYKGKIFMDNRAGLHLPEHTDRSSMSGRHYKIGATGKGCSEAIVDRIKLRGSGGRLFRDWINEHQEHLPLDPVLKDLIWCDTAELLNDAYDTGNRILLEGTQGTLLDLYLGPYPYTTHKQCTAAQWVTEAGLSPSLEYEVALIVRTFPIRVAGNSGPMPGEITWPVLAREINERLAIAGKAPLVDPEAIRMFEHTWEELGKFPYASPEIEASEHNRDTMNRLPEPVQQELRKLFEFTTVTKKLRRIARMDRDELRYSVRINRPAYLCVTFLNYQFPELWGDCSGSLSAGKEGWLMDLGDEVDCPVKYYSTGPETRHFHEFNPQ